MTFLRYLWALPNTLLGLAVALAYGPVGVSWRNGALAIRVRRMVPRWAAGQTLGWVVLLRQGVIAPVDELERLWRHELVHVRQSLRYGPLKLVLYPLASLVALVRGGHPYRDNAFEVEARRGAR